MNFIFLLSYNERLRGENTGWKKKFFIFLHKKYPYDFKIEIIGAFSSTYSVGCFIFCFSNIITVFSVRQSSRQVLIVILTFASLFSSILISSATEDIWLLSVFLYKYFNSRKRLFRLLSAIKLLYSYFYN